MGIRAVLFLNAVQKKGINCAGTVIEYQTDRDGNKIPIIEFKTLKGEFIKGKPIIHVSMDLSGIQIFDNLTTQSIPILYDPEMPEKFVIATEREFNYLTLSFFIIMGLFSIALGISTMLGYINLG